MSTVALSDTRRGGPVRPGRPVRPGSERRLTAFAVALAAVFVGLTLLAALAPGSLGLGPWLPVHLLLAGAASTAIAGVMPFFSAAVASSAPGPAWLRFAAIVGVASGASLVVAGRIVTPALNDSPLAAAGGALFIAGIVCVGAATLWPLHNALGSRRYVIGGIYGIALLNVLAGATLATLLLIGWTPVVANWPALKASHAWFNLFGFVSLVIAGSLLHLLPTVAGARIGRSRASVITFAALASGPPLTAIALGLNLQLIATVGVAVTLGGGIALVIHAMDVLRRTAKWTTDLDWHHFTTWSLMASCGWFVVAVAVAAIPIISSGPWQLLPLMVPFGVGWVLQALVGSWSHLMPAIGPGSPARHGRQRRILGFAGSIRVLAFNAGVAVAVLGIGLGVPALTFIGGVAIVALLALALVLLAFALVARE